MTINFWNILRFFGVMLTGVFLFCAVEFGDIRPYFATRELFVARGPLLASVYLGAYLFSVAGLVILVKLKNAAARRTFLAALIIGLAAHVGTQRIQSDHISVEHFKTAMVAIGFASAFLSINLNSIFLSIALSAVCVFIFSAIARTVLPASGMKSTIIPACGLMLVGSIIWRTNDVQNAFHSPYRVPIIAGLALFDRPLYAGPRSAPPDHLVASEKPDADIIILVVDEFINGHFLGINGYKSDTTPYLASIAPNFVNLGIASSAGNHSAPSNMILQSGLRADQLADKEQLALRGPNIFQLAKKSGYWTAYLDAQTSAGGFNNFMRPTDTQTIDLFFRVADNKSIPAHEKDRAALSKLSEILKQPGRIFIYLVKHGAHFPYETAYPPSQQIFSPTMPNTLSIAETTIEQMKGSYANAIRWSVDGFMKELLAIVDLSRTAIIYTADHGQSVEEGGRGVGTHGKVQNPPKSQAAVPMLAFGVTADNRLRGKLADVYNATSHFQIVPSLLVMMGYPEQVIAKTHGIPLWRRMTEPRVFLSGDLFARGRAFMNKYD